jgi:two-component system chemotaxis response regulator CheB
LDRIPQLKPDIIVLDIEMPVMGGLETLVNVRRAYPKLPVIVFSSDTRPGAEATLDALWLGANDYVTKSSAASPGQAVRHIHAELVPRIKALCMDAIAPVAEHEKRERRARPHAVPGAAESARSGAPHERQRPRERDSGMRPPVQIVAIGASTGGPNALATLLRGLPIDFAVPVVIVQHMPRQFTRFLAERLSDRTGLDIVEAADGDVLRASRIWIAPGGWHMTLERQRAEVCVRLDQSPPVNSCRPSVDVLFGSVADVFAAGALGVILTGMGHDGLRGCERLAWAGGQVLAQDEDTSVVWGMPGIVTRAGIAEMVLPIEEMAPEIVRRVGSGRARRSQAA